MTFLSRLQARTSSVLQLKHFSATTSPLRNHDSSFTTSVSQACRQIACTSKGDLWGAIVQSSKHLCALKTKNHDHSFHRRSSAHSALTNTLLASVRSCHGCIVERRLGRRSLYTPSHSMSLTEHGLRHHAPRRLE